MKKGVNLTKVHCWWECKVVQSLSKAVWNVFKTLKIEHIWICMFLFISLELGIRKGCSLFPLLVNIVLKI
jgi:hypothetical protein